MAPNFLSRLVKGKSKVDEDKVVLPRGLEDAVQEEVRQIAGSLYGVLEAHNMRVSAFKVKEAPYIIPEAIAKERLIQVYSTDDPWLKDVLVDGVSQKDSSHPAAWFAFTSVRVAAGKISMNWKEQLAAKAPKYFDITSVSTDKKGSLIVESPGGKVEAAFSNDVSQDVIEAFQKFIEDRKKKGTQN